MSDRTSMEISGEKVDSVQGRQVDNGRHLRENQEETTDLPINYGGSLQMFPSSPGLMVRSHYLGPNKKTWLRVRISKIPQESTGKLLSFITKKIRFPCIRSANSGINNHAIRMACSFQCQASLGR
jgi:hypothetical protein